MVISATWGLGKPVVDGTVDTDTYGCTATRRTRCSPGTSAPAPGMVAAPDGGVLLADTPAHLREAACLDTGTARGPGEAALLLERFFRRPWTWNGPSTHAGKLVILQARPLRMTPRNPATVPTPARPPAPLR
jgi:pyruvate,water dikinase